MKKAKEFKKKRKIEITPHRTKRTETARNVINCPPFQLHLIQHQSQMIPHKICEDSRKKRNRGGRTRTKSPPLEP